MELNLSQKQDNREKKQKSLLELGSNQRLMHGDSCYQDIFFVDVLLRKKANIALFYFQ